MRGFVCACVVVCVCGDCNWLRFSGVFGVCRQTNVGVYHTKRVSQLLILIKSEITLKIFGPHFPKNFTSVCHPMGPNIQFLKKIVSDNLFHSQTMFHNISR